MFCGVYRDGVKIAQTDKQPSGIASGTCSKPVALARKSPSMAGS